MRYTYKIKNGRIIKTYSEGSFLRVVSMHLRKQDNALSRLCLELNIRSVV